MHLQKSTCILVLSAICICCTPKENSETESLPNPNKIDYIRPIDGIDEPLDPELVKKGKVLISYGDCGTCHTDERRAKGPAFKDIAKRYPNNQIYLDLLARKVISGGKGSWGNPVMAPHPHLKESEALAMVSYILSLE